MCPLLTNKDLYGVQDLCKLYSSSGSRSTVLLKRPFLLLSNVLTIRGQGARQRGNRGTAGLGVFLVRSDIALMIRFEWEQITVWKTDAAQCIPPARTWNGTCSKGRLTATATAAAAVRISMRAHDFLHVPVAPWASAVSTNQRSVRRHGKFRVVRRQVAGRVTLTAYIFTLSLSPPTTTTTTTTVSPSRNVGHHVTVVRSRSINVSASHVPSTTVSDGRYRENKNKN